MSIGVSRVLVPFLRNVPGGSTSRAGDQGRGADEASGGRTVPAPCRYLLPLALLLVAAPGRAADAPPPGDLAALDAAFDGAVAMYQAGGYEGSIAALERVVASAEELPPGADAEVRWARALLRLAHARATVGRTGGAREALERLLAILPSVQADPEQYSPSFRRELERVRARLAAQQRLRLTISSPGRAATAAILCHELGTTPAEVLLPPGHYRVAVAAGGAVETAVFDLTADRTVELAPREPDPPPVADSTAAKAPEPAPRPAAELAPDLSAAAPAALEVRTPAPRPNVWMRPAAWVASSLAVGCAGVAVWQGIAASNASTQARSMVLPDGSLVPGTDPSAYAAAVSSYEAAHRNAWIAGGASAALAAGAALLFVFADKSPVEPVAGGAAVRF